MNDNQERTNEPACETNQSIVREFVEHLRPGLAAKLVASAVKLLSHDGPDVAVAEPFINRAHGLAGLVCYYAKETKWQILSYQEVGEGEWEEAQSLMENFLRERCGDRRNRWAF